LFSRLLGDLGGKKCVIFLIHVKIIAYGGDWREREEKWTDEEMQSDGRK
jgi:hypothetical protein